MVRHNGSVGTGPWNMDIMAEQIFLRGLLRI